MRKVKYEEMGKRIRAARIAKGLKQKDCLEPLGDITPQMLSDWENGYVCPSLTYLINISNYFDVSLDHLVLGKNNDPKDTSLKTYKDIATSLVELEKTGLFRLSTYSVGRTPETCASTDDRTVNAFVIELQKILNASQSMSEALVKQAVAELIEKYNTPLKIK